MNKWIWIPYCGSAPEPAGLIGRWNFDPALLVLIAVLGAVGLARTARQARERTCVAAAISVALVLFVSPFCALTSALFSARSVHHVALTALLAPLIAAALPRALFGARSGGLALWTALAAVTLWLWHAPSLYAAALSNDLVYWLMQASLLGTAIGFWHSARAASTVAAVAACLAYMVQMGLLGALLTFSENTFYLPHALTTADWGFTPLEDQQLAGLVMWVPGALVYLGAAVVRLRRLLEMEDRQVAAPA